MIPGQALDAGDAPVKAPERAGAVDLGARLLFSRNLQHVANRIQAMPTVDDILLDAGADIRRVFNAERIYIYAVSEDGRLLHSKMRATDGSVSDFRRPIKTNSVVGVVANTQTVVNLRNAADEHELAAIHPDLTAANAFGVESGDAPRQVLAVPIVHRGKRGQAAELLGVAQLVNTRSGQPFGPSEVEGFRELCDTLAAALRSRRKESDLASLSARPVRSKYDGLVASHLISAEEIKLAGTSARRKGVDIEEILLTDFQVDRREIGKSLSAFFNVPYEPFKPDRPKPLDLLKQIKREYAQSAQWLPIEDANDELLVLTTDPERIQSSRVVQNIFPRAGKVAYRVTTVDEFQRSLDQFYGEDFGGASANALLESESGLLDGSEPADEATAAADNELVKFVNKVIIDAYQQGASDIHIEPYPGRQKTVIRFRKDGTLQPYVEVPPSYRAPLIARIKIMCDLDISETPQARRTARSTSRASCRVATIELRVAMIPTANGLEDAVLRILAVVQAAAAGPSLGIVAAQPRGA